MICHVIGGERPHLVMDICRNYLCLSFASVLVFALDGLTDATHLVYIRLLVYLNFSHVRALSGVFGYKLSPHVSTLYSFNSTRLGQFFGYVASWIDHYGHGVCIYLLGVGELGALFMHYHAAAMCFVARDVAALLANAHAFGLHRPHTVGASLGQ